MKDTSKTDTSIAQPLFCAVVVAQDKEPIESENADD